MPKISKSEHPDKDIFSYNDSNPITKNVADHFALHSLLTSPKTDPSIRITP